VGARVPPVVPQHYRPGDGSMESTALCVQFLAMGLSNRVRLDTDGIVYFSRGHTTSELMNHVHTVMLKVRDGVHP